jgi:hypothetical protein
VGEAVQEPGAPVQLNEHRRERRERKQRGQLVLELGGLGRDVFGRQLGDDQVAVLVQPYRPLAVGQRLVQLADRRVEFGLHLRERLGAVGGDADQPAELLPLPRPRVAGDEVGNRVGVAA